MRAVRVPSFGPATVIQVADVDVPTLAEGEVLVRVMASSVTPLDTYLRRGVPIGEYTPVPPYTPGAALSGVVEAVGPGADQFAVMDRIYGRARSGGAAEYAACLADQIYPLPPAIGFADGALVAVPFETAYHSLVDLAACAGGDTVLVQGAAGSVGAASVQIARALGLHVIATCAGADQAKVLEHGAHAAIDYKATDVAEQVRAANRGRGVDIVIEVATRANLALDLEIAAPGGRIVIVGGTGWTQFDARPVIAKGLRLAGVDLRAMGPRRARQINAAIVAGLDNGTLRPHAAHRFPLSQAADAHAAIEAGHAPGGVVLLPDEG